MKDTASPFNRCCMVISLLLLMPAPVLPQYQDRLGGNWNTIIRLARTGRETGALVLV